MSFLLLQVDVARGQGTHSLGRSSGGVDRLQAERGISDRFPSSRLTLDPEQYGGLATFPNLGALRVLPYYQFSTAFTDNVFLVPDAFKDSDWAFVNTPGLMMTLTGKHHLFELDYSADIIANAKYKEFDRVEHDLDTRLTLTPVRYFSVAAENEFMIRGVPPQLGAVTPTTRTVVPKQMYLDNNTTVMGTYHFGKKTDAELTYSHEFVRFEKKVDQISNFTVDSLGLDLYYRILPKTRLYAEYVTSFVNNAEGLPDPTTGQSLSTDNVRFQVSGGAAWDATARLHGRVHGGYEWMVYKDLPVSPGPFYDGELQYDYSRRLRFGLRLLQTITETSAAANNTQNGANFQTTEAGLRATYRVLRNLDWHVEGFYVDDNFGFQKNDQSPIPQSNRNDRLIGVETGLDWHIKKNVMVGVSYQFQNNDSTGEVPGAVPGVSIPSGELNSFTENLVTLYLSLVF